MSYDIFQPVHEDFRKNLRQFVENELFPHVEEWEEAEEFPREVYKTLGELGFLGMSYPEEYGGDDDRLAEAVFHEEVTRCGSAGVASGIGAHIGIAMPQINRFGTPEQKEKYLVPGIRGETIGALGVTEPEAGSDVAGIKSYAVRDGSDWIINGSKTFITNGVRCDWVVALIKTDREKGYSGISQFIIDRGTPGFETSRKLKKLGWKASDTGELAFSDVRVPADALLGSEGSGFFQTMANFVWERLIMSLGAVEGAKLLFELALQYAKERHAFGKPIGKFQAISHMLADMITEIELGRSFTYDVLKMYIEGKEPMKEVAMAKLYTQSMACRVADRALQIYGGYGYMEEYPIARAWRDMRLGPIGGGTDEIMKEIIARSYGL
ncbi:MAG: acyl-CoA dehydrogenase family protein [Actinobacteria bacterium]|nr:acyl-CoA dehydrogenase family protein [Actinomycetota bacterium]